MANEDWYATRNDEQIGPLAIEALQQMARSQGLGRDDLVWQVGTPGWIAAGQVPTLCEAAGWGSPQVPSLPQAPRVSVEEQYRPHLQDLRSRVGELDETTGALEALPHLRFVNRMLEKLGRQVTVHQLDLADRLMKRTGSLAYMLAAVLYCAFFAIMSLRADSIQQLLATLLIVVPSASLCHFIAIHFIESGESMLRQTPTMLSSKNLAMSIGLLTGAVSLFVLVFASHDLFRKVNVIESILAISIGLILLYTAAACLNPASLNLTVGARADAAREAVAISMFLAKLPLRLIPSAFGLFSILAAASATFFCHQLMKGDDLELRFAQAQAIAPRALLIGLLPVALYLVAVFTVLLTDVFRAGLDTPDEIRDLAEVLKRAEGPRESTVSWEQG